VDSITPPGPGYCATVLLALLLYEERQIDRNQQTFPFVVVHQKTMEPMDLTRNAPVTLAGVAIKQDAAGLARASDSTLLHFQKVSVHWSNRFCA
jgi:hypothetical protein